MPSISAGSVNVPIWGEIDVAPSGHMFADATYSMVIGERKNANLMLKGRNRPDWITRPFFDMMDAEIDVDLYENSLQTLYNWVLMSKAGLSSWRFKGPDSKWWNFVANTGSIGTPAGTWQLGTTVQYVCGDKERSIKIKAAGGGYRQEWKYLTANGGSGLPGTTGGMANISGFTHLSYDINAVGPPGIVSLAVGADSVPFVEEGSVLTLDFTQMGVTSPRHQPILGMLKVKLELNTWNSDLAQTQAALEALLNDDISWTLTMAPTPGDVTALRPDPTIVLASSVFQNPTVSLEETSKFMTKISLEGGAPVDNPGWAGTNIVFDPTTTNSITVNRIGVA